MTRKHFHYAIDETIIGASGGLSVCVCSSPTGAFTENYKALYLNKDGVCTRVRKEAVVPDPWLIDLAIMAKTPYTTHVSVLTRDDDPLSVVVLTSNIELFKAVWTNSGLVVYP